jgi:hypothetical protein
MDFLQWKSPDSVVTYPHPAQRPYQFLGLIWIIELLFKITSEIKQRRQTKANREKMRMEIEKWWKEERKLQEEQSKETRARRHKQQVID